MLTHGCCGKQENMTDYYRPNHIPIVFASDNYFVPYMAAMMQSIMENASTTRQYIFFVLHRDITTDTQQTVQQQIAIFNNFSVLFIDVTHYFAGQSLFTASRKEITVETYFRLLIPQLFSEYEKVIYLDGDMICLSDISELYNYDIGDNFLLATRDIHQIALFYPAYQKLKSVYKKSVSSTKKGILEINNISNYFNGGALVFNMAQFCKSFSADKILDFAASQNWNLHDQDVLNVLCENKVLFISSKWNFIYEKKRKVLMYTPDFLQNEYFEGENAPAIIHYASTSKKPWENSVQTPYAGLFWKYAARTPFISTIITRMQAKHLVNDTIYECVAKNIIYRQGISIKFILKCFWKRFLRDAGFIQRKISNE
ncbi:MAG: hypothetical protein Ta2B_17260 [Termitinemataceae bacterium]|nr:MAG: hypothetical protein Ta2B_17260 [Termitinemataceae bacterium]